MEQLFAVLARGLENCGCNMDTVILGLGRNWRRVGGRMAGRETIVFGPAGGKWRPYLVIRIGRCHCSFDRRSKLL